MTLNIPRKHGVIEEQFIDIERSIVIVGANGSGKTRFGTQIEMGYPGETHRISAQKSLKMPASVSTIGLDEATNKFHYGYHQEGISEEQLSKNAVNMKWHQNPNTHTLDNFEDLLTLLHSKEFVLLSQFKNRVLEAPTPLDIIKRIWEGLLPHRQLNIEGATIKTSDINDPNSLYNSSEMSDGERVIFYLIGSAICSKPNALIVIDEPELHLHKSITKKLWDAIEMERRDCIFIYLTHDLDFAFTREKSTKIWIKNYYSDNTWEYSILQKTENIPEQLYLEILGSRKPILFIEGTNSSLDYRLYLHLFHQYNVIPVGGCVKVLEITKSFKTITNLHYSTSNGIIDKDRRTQTEIENIRGKGIWVTDVSESENILMLEVVIRIVAAKKSLDPESTFSQVKTSVLSLFRTQLSNQVSEHCLYQIKQQLDHEINFKTAGSAELDQRMKTLLANFDYLKIYNDTETLFKEYLEAEDYQSILRVFNKKDLANESKVANICKLHTVKKYEDYFIEILMENTENSCKVIEEIRSIII